MSKFFHLTKRPVKKIKKLPGLKMNFKAKTLNVMMITLLISVGVVYLAQMNSLATKGYQIRELENEISELEQSRSDLELEALSLQSMGSVGEKVQDLGMIAVNEADYLQPTPVAVAR